MSDDVGLFRVVVKPVVRVLLCVLAKEKRTTDLLPRYMYQFQEGEAEGDEES